MGGAGAIVSEELCLRLAATVDASLRKDDWVRFIRTSRQNADALVVQPMMDDEQTTLGIENFLFAPVAATPPLKKSRGAVDGATPPMKKG